MVMPRPLLTDAQRAALFDLPTTERDLIRHYTLTAADLALIARQRLDHTRLGFALMLCSLRYPGRLLREGERPPAAFIRFVAEQVGVFPEAFEDYLRHDHVAMPPNCSSSFATASTRLAMRKSWRHGCCQPRLLPTGPLHWLALCWTNCAGGASCCRHRR